MSKLLVALFATSFGMAAGFFAGPRILYSGLQPKVPFGSGIKVLPDPTNIWSWHHTQTGDGTVSVVVDFDGNGKMDTENQCFRVMVTDMQVSFPHGNTYAPSQIHSITLDDDKGPLWDLLEPMTSGTNPFYRNHTMRLATPLVLSVGSRLFVSIKGFGPQSIHFHLIGRISNL